MQQADIIQQQQQQQQQKQAAQKHPEEVRMQGGEAQ
jgi:hypothetical protein